MSSAIPRRRTRAREAALQFLYQVDLCGESVLDDLDAFLADEGRHEDVRDFARELILGTVGSLERIDALLGRVAKNWDLHRMAAVDRNVLRLAVHELLDRPDIPPKVTINEAIELAKRFSTANSGAFVNGILDRVRIDHSEGAATIEFVATDPPVSTPLNPEPAPLDPTTSDDGPGDDDAGTDDPDVPSI